MVDLASKKSRKSGNVLFSLLMLWLLIQYLTSEFSWNLIPKWERGNLLNMKFPVKVKGLFDSEWPFGAFPSARCLQYRLFAQLQWKAVRQKSPACAEILMQLVQGSSGIPTLPCAVQFLHSGEMQESTRPFQKFFSQASILTLNYYHLSPAQTGKKGFTQHTYFCSEVFPICDSNSMKVRIMKKENEYQLTQFT